MDPQAAKSKSMEAARVAYFSIASALMLYAMMVESIPGPSAGASSDTLPVMRVVFYAISVGCAVLVWVLPRLMLQSAPVPCPFPRRLTAALVSWAVAETPAILGLILYFLGGVKGDFYRLAAWSLALMIFAYPRKSRWE